jgi:hypothetical protein
MLHDRDDRQQHRHDHDEQYGERHDADGEPAPPPTRACTISIMGQVATTIIVAHTVAPTNGHNIHRLAAIMRPMDSTPSVMRQDPAMAADGSFDRE